MLYFIGLGLGDETDITVKGRTAIEQCQYVYLDYYTAVLGISTDELSTFYNKDVIVADRELIESGTEILQRAADSTVALLVVGDCFAATTHHDLYLRAVQQNIKIAVVHNTSIVNAVGICGLQLYRYGQIVTIPYFTATWQPTSFYDKIRDNSRLGLHTLCLLDIKVKEQSAADMARGVQVYQPSRFMSVNQAVQQLLDTHSKLSTEYDAQNNATHCKHFTDTDSKQQSEVTAFTPAYTPDTCAIGVARIGSSTEQIVSGTLSELPTIDFGAPLHSLILCGTMHDVELDMYNHYHWNRAQRIADKQHQLALQQQQLDSLTQQQQQAAQQRLLQQAAVIQQRKQARDALIAHEVQQRKLQQQSESDEDVHVDMSKGLFD